MHNIKKYREIILYGVLILLVLCMLVSKIIPRAVELFNLKRQIHDKKAQVESLLKEVKSYEEYEQLKKQSITSLKKIYSLESPADTVENSFVMMLDDIINITKYNNVKIFSVQYSYNPADDEFVAQGQGKFDACRLDLELISDYQNFVSMLIELIKYPYYLKINNFKIIPYQKDKKILLIQLSLVLYVERNEASPPPIEPPKNEQEQQGDQNQQENNDNQNQEAQPQQEAPPKP